MRSKATIVLAGTALTAVLVLGLAVGGLASTGGVAAGTTSEETHESTTEGPVTTPYRAALTSRAEVPRPKGTRAGAGGTLSLKLTHSGSSYSIAWTLTYRKLTGKAAAAHLHRGKAGKAGPVLVSLCSPCRSGQKGKAGVAKPFVTALEGGAVYVNVHTATNAAGEIRGQVKPSG
jgi:hypothetical protein